MEQFSSNKLIQPVTMKANGRTNFRKTCLISYAVLIGLFDFESNEVKNHLSDTNGPI